MERGKSTSQLCVAALGGAGACLWGRDRGPVVGGMFWRKGPSAGIAIS
jgi:hypothetical protein